MSKDLPTERIVDFNQVSERNHYSSNSRCRKDIDISVLSILSNAYSDISFFNYVRLSTITRQLARVLVIIR